MTPETTLIIEMLKRTSDDIQDLRDDIKNCVEDIHAVKLQINNLENHDRLSFDPEEMKKIRNKSTQIASGAGAGVAGIVIACYEFIKTYFVG